MPSAPEIGTTCKQAGQADAVWLRLDWLPGCFAQRQWPMRSTDRHHCQLANGAGLLNHSSGQDEMHRACCSQAPSAAVEQAASCSGLTAAQSRARCSSIGCASAGAGWDRRAPVPDQSRSCVRPPSNAPPAQVWGIKQGESKQGENRTSSCPLRWRRETYVARQPASVWVLSEIVGCHTLIAVEVACAHLERLLLLTDTRS